MSKRVWLNQAESDLLTRIFDNLVEKSYDQGLGFEGKLVVELGIDPIKKLRAKLFQPTPRKVKP